MENKSLDELGREIEKAKNSQKIPDGDEPDSSNISPLRVGVELVAGVIVGAGGGLLLDHWLATLPLFFLIFFTLGVLGSGLNIYRLANPRKNK